MNLFDFLSSDNMIAYWLEKNVNKQPLLGETLFPSRKQIGIKLDWVKGAKGQPVGLRLSAFDSKSIRRDREGIEQYTTKMPFFKESMYIDEEMRQLLNIYAAANNSAMAEDIIAKIFDDQVKLIDAALITVERMRMQALTTGSITLASNGQGYEYDFGTSTQYVDSEESIHWSDSEADIIGDIVEIVDKMKAKGVTITRAVCNNSVAKQIRKNDAIKNQIYVLAGGNIASVTAERALNYIYEETGVSIYVYDNVYVDERGETHKYVPDNTIVFMPEGPLGHTNFGTTPEESDLLASNTADVKLVNNAIAVTNHVEHDPVLVETKVSMIALPSFERADEVYIFDTNNDPLA